MILKPVVRILQINEDQFVVEFKIENVNSDIHCQNIRTSHDGKLIFCMNGTTFIMILDHERFDIKMEGGII